VPRQTPSVTAGPVPVPSCLALPAFFHARRSVFVWQAAGIPRTVVVTPPGRCHPSVNVTDPAAGVLVGIKRLTVDREKLATWESVTPWRPGWRSRASPIHQNVQCQNISRGLPIRACRLPRKIERRTYRKNCPPVRGNMAPGVGIGCVRLWAEARSVFRNWYDQRERRSRSENRTPVSNTLGSVAWFIPPVS